MAKKPYERSGADKRIDKAAARKAGMTAKQYENMPKDRRADAKAMMARKGKR